jgi:hypothetical protein
MRPATIVATTPPASGEAHPVYTRWWFWTIVGVVAAGAVITAVAVSSGGSSGSWNNLPPLQAGLVR